MANGVGGGCVRVVGVVVALGLIGYNTWEIARLRSEVNALKSKSGVASSSSARSGKPGVTAPQTSSPDGAAALFGQARDHAERAERLLRMKKYDEARREIALAAKSAKSANEGARAGTEDAMRGLESALRRLSQDAGRLWDSNNAGDKEKAAITVREKSVRDAPSKNDKKP